MTKELCVEAKIENISTVTAFVDEILEENNCSMKAQMQIDVAIDEIFGNIAYYAYGEKGGDATVGVEIADSPKRAIIKFIDSGTPYNPLEKEDPDTTLSAEERGIGGLGIFIVKKSMDSVTYDYSENKNILTLTKNI